MYIVHCMYSFVSFDTLHLHFQWIAVIKNNSVRKTQVHTCTCTYMYMYIAVMGILTCTCTCTMYICIYIVLC